MNNIIEVNNLTKDYKNDKGIFDFSFSVKKGEVFGIVGTNGSGKTTTLRHLMGFIKQDNGSCSILGLDCLKDSKEIKKSIGYVPGEINFPDVGSGETFLKLQASYLGITDLSYLNKLIDLFKLDTSAPLRKMSKGMKQKTALVACFMGQPDIYLLDEPSTGLDPLMQDTLIQLILEQKKLGKTIIISSHIFKELEKTCDTVLFINNGKIINFIDKSKHTNDLLDQYKIIFEKESEFSQYLSETKFSYKVINNNSIILLCKKESINHLFKEISKYDIKSINLVPYTLEGYYLNEVLKGGIV